MLASSVACLIWSWAAGKDLNWDQLNYHFYTAYHYLEDRVEQDFMGASTQGYFNPLGYLPFYLMVRANWPSLLIGSVLALIHSTCLWFIYGISRELVPADTRFRTALIAAAVALAFLAPIYLLEVGSTFIDVTTTIPILAGILLLLLCDRSRHGGWLVLLAGLLMGAASGLKLTNAIFAVAASAFIILASRPVKVRIRDLGLYVAGGFVGLLLVGGAWAYRLFKAFGNPLFPLFNAWFQSPDLPAFESRNYRFSPEGLRDYLLFPIRVLDIADYVYIEESSPDVRFFALFALLAALGLALLIRRRKPMAATAGGPGTSTSHRRYAAALVFTLTSYLLWLHSSGNGRYALPLELFIGPMIVASVLVFSRSLRTRAYLMGSILLVQATVVYTSADRRCQPADWTATWFDVSVPPLLQQRDFLYLSLDLQTAAFLAPFLNSGSSFVNLVGGNSLALDRPGGKRLGALLDRHRPNIRTLILLRVRTETGDPGPRMFAIQDTLLERVGLRADPRDCVSIEVRGLLPSSFLERAASVNAEMQYASDRKYLTCGTMPVEKTDLNAQSDELRTRVDRAFDMIEAHCPRLFSPPGPYTDHVDTAFVRNYANTDTILRVFDGHIQYSSWKADGFIVLGRIGDILDGSAVPNCRLLGRKPFRKDD